jgi:hypothetical protein
MPNGLYKTNDDKKSVISNGDSVIESVVMTDPKFAKRIIDYFSPQFKSSDTFLDPCRGDGAFYKHLPKPKEYCELQEGKDFFNNTKHYAWIFGNFPWRGKVYAPFAKHAFQHADNVVQLVKLFGALGTNRRLRDADDCNMKMKEIMIVDWKDANFKYIDGSSKAAEGFSLSVVHWKKNYKGGTKWNYDWIDL